MASRRLRLGAERPSPTAEVTKTKQTKDFRNPGRGGGRAVQETLEAARRSARFLVRTIVVESVEYEFLSDF